MRKLEKNRLKQVSMLISGLHSENDEGRVFRLILTEAQRAFYADHHV